MPMPTTTIYSFNSSTGYAFDAASFLVCAALLTLVPVEAGRTEGDGLGYRRQLSDGLNTLRPLLSASTPQTNIVQVDLAATGRSSLNWVDDLEAAGVRTRPLGEARLRLVTHRHINAADIERVIAAFRTCLEAI